MSRAAGGVVLAGRYRLISPVAAGAVGEVWQAADLVLSRPVAVKLLRAEHAGHAETLARFRAEARLTASLAHPGIAQVFDYGDGDTGAGQRPFLVMELVDGPSLAGLLAAGPLDAATTVDVIAQAAAGLHAAHQAGLVHRDIKPANLLLGPGGQVKITDFGIAHAAGSAPLTRTGMLIGTPAYLAPERAAGHPAGPPSDLYSLGIVGYECLVGVAPFTGMAIEVALAHRDRPLPALPPAVPGPVAALVAELTAKNPAARPTAAQAAATARSAQEAITASGTIGLAAAPGATSVLDQPEPPVSGRGGVPWQRLALVLAAVLAVCLLGVLLAAVVSPGPPHATAQPPAQPSATRPARPAHPHTKAPGRSPATPAREINAARLALTRAENAGAIPPPAATDLQNRLNDIATAIAQGNLQDAGHKAADLLHHLADLTQAGQITPAGVAAIQPPLSRLAALLPAQPAASKPPKPKPKPKPAKH